MPIYKEINHDFFKLWTPEMAYVLGFFSADGSMIKNKRGACFIEFEITDKELLKKIKEALGSNHKISERKRNEKWKTSYRLQIGSGKIFKDLLSMGITPNKSKTICLPDVPDNCFSHFTRGYFDGDGNVVAKFYKKPKSSKQRLVFLVRFTSGSRLFLESLRDRIKELASAEGFVIKRKNWYILTYSIFASRKLFQFMYLQDGNNLYLKRKKKIFDSYFAMC
ncbi:MAG: LAGLIDADG family homing endonuclease [Minisyncoccales bacterium]